MYQYIGVCMQICVYVCVCIYTCVCIYMNHFAIQQKQHCRLTILKFKKNLSNTLACNQNKSKHFTTVCNTPGHLAPTCVPLAYGAPTTLVFLLAPDHNKLLPDSEPLYLLFLSAFESIPMSSRSMSVPFSSFSLSS